LNKFFSWMGHVIEDKRALVLLISIVLLAGALFWATRLTWATGIDTMISPDSQVYRDFQEFNRYFGNETLVLLVKGDALSQLIELENVRAMDSIEQKMSSADGVLSVVGPGFALRQAMAQVTSAAVLPPDEATSQALILSDGQVRPELKSFFPTDNYAIIVITMDGQVTAEQVDAAEVAANNAIASAGFIGVEASVTGSSVIMKEMKNMMSVSMGTMVMVSLGLMLAILAIIFSVRGFFVWRWLPLGAVVIGSIYAFGMMGWLSVPITMATMAILPILIGLGVDYAVQFHNRYDEEARRGETVAAAIIDSVTHIGPAIAIAIIAACLGFAALLLSPVPMVQQFGGMLIVGVVACYLVSLFILLPILYSHDRRKKNSSVNSSKMAAADNRAGIVERALGSLAPRVIRNPALIISGALILAVVGLVLDSRIATETDENKYISENLPLMKDFNALSALSGGSAALNILVKGADVTRPDILNWMLNLEGRILAQSVVPVVGVSSIADTVAQLGQGQIPPGQEQVSQLLSFVPDLLKRNLIFEDLTAANITIRTAPGVNTENLEALRSTVQRYVASRPQGVAVTVTGHGIIGIEVMKSLTSGRVQMTLLGIALVFLGLFMLFKLNALRTLIATLPIAMIIGWSSVVMYLSGIKYTALTATLGSLIIGIGVEFTILMMMRYQEERDKGASPTVAMTIAMTKIGRAVITSGLTVVGGFGALLFARDFPILTDFGAVTMINVFFALVSSLVVLPTIIVALDQRREKRLART